MISTTNDIRNLDTKATRFLDNARLALSTKDFRLLLHILSEWHSAPCFMDLLAKWDHSKKATSSVFFYLPTHSLLQCSWF